MVNVGVIGAGFVGAVSAACFTDLGNNVICADKKPEVVASFREGMIPFYEPELNALVSSGLESGRLEFTQDTAQAVQESDLVFICVDTPPGEGGSANISNVLAVAGSIGDNLNGYTVVAQKSTAPPGTCGQIGDIIFDRAGQGADFDVVSNPEFLREGAAVHDFRNPERVVVGVSRERPKGMMEEVYHGVVRDKRPLIFTDVRSAELSKYACNTMLAARISFMNELAGLCEKIGADISEVRRAMAYDSRIGGRFLSAGVGYGGSCFPKDVIALRQMCIENGLEGSFPRAIHDVNERQMRSLVPKLEERLVGGLSGKRIGVLGLSFKPRTSDMRAAPSIVVINQLLERDAEVVAYDPLAMDAAQSEDFFSGGPVDYALGVDGVIEGSDGVVLVTEHDEFRNIDFYRFNEGRDTPLVVVDGRNVYDPKQMSDAGIIYVGVGR